MANPLRLQTEKRPTLDTGNSTFDEPNQAREVEEPTEGEDLKEKAMEGDDPKEKPTAKKDSEEELMADEDPEEHTQMGNQRKNQWTSLSLNLNLKLSLNLNLKPLIGSREGVVGCIGEHVH